MSTSKGRYVGRAGEKLDGALEHFGVEMGADYEPPGCLCGQVIQGKVAPAACPLFGSQCTPLSPVGPCMVSSEGTCAAWYKYGRTGERPQPTNGRSREPGRDARHTG